jgi:hypothetical protein
LIGYQLSDKDDGTFGKEQVVAISSGVEDKIYFNFINVLWSTMKDTRYNSWRIFEGYIHHIMAKGVAKNVQGVL